MMQNIKFIILGLIITAGISYTFAGDFNYPCISGAPNCNTDLPVNSSTTPQAKTGPLSVGTGSLPATGFIFNVPSGTSYFDGLATVGLQIKAGAGNGKVLKYNSGTGVAGWGDLTYINSVTSSMRIEDFILNVPRNSDSTNGVSLVIPSTYQYCSITQLGPDFSNSNGGDESRSSVCSVNRNTDGTWKLYGSRPNDPDFVCKASCFTLDSKTAEYNTTNFIPSPGVLSPSENRIMESQIGAGEGRIYIK